MNNHVIKPEWIPSAYRDDAKAGTKTDLKKASGNTALYAGKGSSGKNSFRRKTVK